MKKVELVKIQHNRKLGEKCEYIEPNITEDTIFTIDNKNVGFYLAQMPENLCKLADLCDAELRSKRVPKQDMARQIPDGYGADGKAKYISSGVQYSTIIGGVPAKPYLRRNYNSVSSVHQSKTAQTYIKAMYQLAKETEYLIQEILPDIYKHQKETMADIESKYKIGNLFTSSIANYNISAPFHLDTQNIKNTINVIITKRLNSKGGSLFVPDYNACIEQKNNSLLVYPAWHNVHAVTPIIPTFEGGYRNSLVFYPLKAFLNKE
jgi:hypothetical protein